MQVKSYIERVVICLNEDGTLKAAHQEVLHQTLRDDGTPLPGGGNMEPASSVDASTLAGIIDQSAMLAQNASQLVKIEDLIRQLAETNAELESTRSELYQLRQSMVTN